MIGKNDNKPGYKHTPVGWIPEEWEVKPLGELFIFKNGLNKEKKYFGEGTPIVNYMDVFKNNFITSSTLKGKVKVTKNELKNFEVRKDDVFFTRTSETIEEIGFAAVVIEDIEDTVFSGFVLRARPTNNILDTFYKMYCFGNENIRKEITTKSTHTTRALTNGTLLASVQIAIPPLYEQIKIAAILRVWDEAISKTQQLIAQLQKQYKGLTQKLLSGKKRLGGYEMCEWKKLHATDIFKSVSVKNNGKERLLSATQDKGIIPRDMLTARVTMPAGETGSFKLVEIGDFVISLRSFEGGIEYSEYKGLVSPAYTVLKPAKQISNSFFKYYFKSYDFIGHLAVAVVGIRDGKQVSYEDFSILRLPYPTIEEQEAISELLDAAAKELQLQRQKLAGLQQQKKGLMQKLLAGEVRVKINKNSKN